MKDVILSIQGKQVKNVNEFIAVLRARDKSKAVTVELMRAQKKLTVNLLLEQD